MEELIRWMTIVSGTGWFWFVKILSANDTLANGAHQAGPYISKAVFFDLFPSLEASNTLNPRLMFDVAIDSHDASANATAIWYNNKVVAQGTRNEARLTGWGGRSSPLLDPESTGSLCVFAFHRENTHGDVKDCRVWLCKDTDEEDAVTDRVGPVEPGASVFFDASRLAVLLLTPPPADSPCALTREELPDEWRLAFPEAQAVVARAVANLPSARRQSPDNRLLMRRDCEFDLFRSIENLVVLPRIREGFGNVDLFVAYANSVTNRRKSRSGMSLELHAKRIFDEEGVDYSYDESSEGNKRPDFLFPSAEAYRNINFPDEHLRMLGVKTTCKDRWRQVLNEATRVRQKHLLTLQLGVSQNQFQEMDQAGIILVVPEPLHSNFHPRIRPRLVSLAQFIASTKVLGT